MVYKRVWNTTILFVQDERIVRSYLKIGRSIKVWSSRFPETMMGSTLIWAVFKANAKSKSIEGQLIFVIYPCNALETTVIGRTNLVALIRSQCRLLWCIWCLQYWLNQAWYPRTSSWKSPPTTDTNTHILLHSLFWQFDKPSSLATVLLTHL